MKHVELIQRAYFLTILRMFDIGLVNNVKLLKTVMLKALGDISIFV
ncbi:hypothetical protein [Streptococcus pyogenes]|nr:hypothetical protein [Streptococcus pyogenes]